MQNILSLSLFPPNSRPQTQTRLISHPLVQANVLPPGYNHSPWIIALKKDTFTRNSKEPRGRCGRAEKEDREKVNGIITISNG